MNASAAPAKTKGSCAPAPDEAAPADGPVRPDSSSDSIAALLDRVEERFTEEAVVLVRDAYNLAAAAHRGQKRASGEPYITHPLAVAHILADLGLDAATLAAALLHDVVEDTPIEEGALQEHFGAEVARLVRGVTKISAIEAREKQALRTRAAATGAQDVDEAENLRRMLLAAVDDLRVILIKMADRLHNMRTLSALSEGRRMRLAEETLEIYAPLANRLGIWQLKSEFEDRALRELQPETYERIDIELADRRAEHETYLAKVIAELQEALEHAGIEARISGRTKHIYSIFRKMERKDLSADEIFDVLAVRVVVGALNECYVALGIVHAMWRPMEGGFDDYIAKQKYNLYQSLHTTVYGPENRPLEVQLRTEEMHEVAEYGVAAHWMYKEDTPRAREIEKKIAALRKLLKSHSEEADDADAFVEGLKTDVFRDQVYVFTPRGDVIELPAGSTPVDFAYHIHTEVGHRCRGALVNGRMVPLDQCLRTGETVEIVTASGQAGPSRDWLNPALGYVASNRAQSKIKQWFRRKQKQAAIGEGRDVVDRQLRKLGLTKVSHEDVAAQFDYETLEEFLAAVGRHDIPSESIAARLLEAEGAGEPADRERATPRRVKGAPPAKVERTAPTGVTMRGADGLFTRMAGCCAPVPGEDVVGYVTRGRGVTLHRRSCSNIARRVDAEPERFIRVNWEQSSDNAYPVELRVEAYDRSGLVRDISDVIARRDVNMTSVSAEADPADGTAVVTAIVHVPSYADLNSLIDKLQTVDNVIEVRRQRR